MQICVAAVATNRFFTLDVDPSDFVANVKSQIHEKAGIPPSLQRLVFAGKQLEDRRTLRECGITEASTVHLVPTTPFMDGDDDDGAADKPLPWWVGVAVTCGVLLAAGVLVHCAATAMGHPAGHAPRLLQQQQKQR
jgi:hypothetical protein